MKIMLRTALAALSIASIGTAYAGEGEGPAANTRFTALPDVIAQAPVQSSQAVAEARNQSGTAIYVARQQSTSAFPWNPNEGVGN